MAEQHVTTRNIIYAAERPDGLGFIVWRPAEGQTAFAVVKGGESLAAIPLSTQNGIEVAVELMGRDPEELSRYAATLPAAVALGIAGALLLPHAGTILGAAAVAKQAKALEAGDGCAESA